MSIAWTRWAPTPLLRRHAEELGRNWLEQAGIVVGGSAPHDIQIHDPRFFERVFRDGTLGFGESYMDGWWDSDALDETITKLLVANVDAAAHRNVVSWLHLLQGKLVNLQSGAHTSEWNAIQSHALACLERDKAFQHGHGVMLEREVQAHATVHDDVA